MPFTKRTKRPERSSRSSTESSVLSEPMPLPTTKDRRVAALPSNNSGNIRTGQRTLRNGRKPVTEDNDSLATDDGSFVTAASHTSHFFDARDQTLAATTMGGESNSQAREQRRRNRVVGGQNESVLVVPGKKSDATLRKRNRSQTADAASTASAGEESFVSLKKQELDEANRSTIINPCNNRTGEKRVSKKKEMRNLGIDWDPTHHPLRRESSQRRSLKRGPAARESRSRHEEQPKSPTRPAPGLNRKRTQPSRSFLNSPMPAPETKSKRPAPSLVNSSMPAQEMKPKRSVQSLLNSPMPMPAQRQQQQQTKLPPRPLLNSPVPAAPSIKSAKGQLEQRNGTKKVHFIAATKGAKSDPRPKKRRRVSSTDSSKSIGKEEPRKRAPRKVAPQMIYAVLESSDDGSSVVETIKAAKKRKPKKQPGLIQRPKQNAKTQSSDEAELLKTTEPRRKPAPKNVLFSQSANNNLSVLYNLVRAHLAMGEIRVALEICHSMLKSSYQQAATKLIRMLSSHKLHGKRSDIVELRLMREKTAGFWCLYAHLLIQIAETDTFLDRANNHANNGERREVAFNSMEEDLWDQAIEILSLSTGCPFVGNHSSITLALSRLRLRRRERGELRKFPWEDSTKLTTAYFANSLSSVAHWTNNLRAALQICRDGMERSTPSVASSTQPSSEHAAYDGYHRLEEGHGIAMTTVRISDTLFTLLDKLIERNSGEDNENAFSRPPVGADFFSSVLNLPKHLEEALRIARHEPNQQQAPNAPSPNKPLPYLFVDRTSTRFLCLEMNCLSRLKQRLREFDGSTVLRLLFAPTCLSKSSRANASGDGNAWDESLLFQSMNAVLIEEGEVFRYNQLTMQLSNATPFFRSESHQSPSSRQKDSMRELDVSMKNPSYYVWYGVSYVCPKCAYISNTRVNFLLHRRRCEIHGKGVSCRGQDYLGEAWEDLSFAKRKQDIEDAKRDGLRTKESVCFDIVDAAECWAPPSKCEGRTCLDRAEVDDIIDDASCELGEKDENGDRSTANNMAETTTPGVANLSNVFNEEAETNTLNEADSSSDDDELELKQAKESSDPDTAKPNLVEHSGHERKTKYKPPALKPEEPTGFPFSLALEHACRKGCFAGFPSEVERDTHELLCKGRTKITAIEANGNKGGQW